MRGISVHVSEADYAAFQSLAAQDERPGAELIREAVSRWLVEHPRTGGSLVGIRPVDCGVPLQPVDRSEVADEMFDRGVSASTPMS
jgi:hypothetical protein